MSAPRADEVVVPLLDLDPDLAAAAAPALREQMRAWLAVPVMSLPRGPWNPNDVEPGGMGLLIVGGVLVRSVALARVAAPELLGRGDLVRPGQHDVQGRLGPVNVSWQVLEPCRVAVLDRRFAGIVGRYPEVVDALLERAIARAHALDVQLAIAQLPLLEARILALLWHLADRWGTPGPDGVKLPLRLTHSLLAALVFGRRPSVSTALTDLAQRGLVSRVDDGWLLHGEPPTELHAVSRRGRHEALSA